MMILCPFHDDRAPSCSVDLQKQVFLCFGCGARGDLFTLLMGMGYSIPEAARVIADESLTMELLRNRRRSGDYRPILRPPSPKRAIRWLARRGIEVNEAGEITNIDARKLPTFSEGDDVLSIRAWCAVLRNDVLTWEQWQYFRVMGRRKAHYFSTNGFPRGRCVGVGGERDGHYVYVSEGSFDALSVLLAQDRGLVPCGPSYYTFGASVAVCQSVLLRTLAGGRRVVLCYDRDEAGLDATLSLLRIFPEALVCEYDGPDPGEASLESPWVLRDGMEFLLERTR